MTTLKTIEGSPSETADHTFPFQSAEEAWFWFIQAQTARNDGAKISAGSGLYPRPCEPVDIIRTVERIYRNCRISMDHVMVMKHYGLRMLAPNKYVNKEKRSHTLWTQAMERLEESLIAKRIVVKPHWLTLVVNHDAR